MNYSLAIFSSYFLSEEIPDYTKDYLNELSNYFDKVILVTTKDLSSERDLIFLEDGNIHLEVVKNEGFDFGMHAKIIGNLRIRKIDKLGLFNDSVILCGSLLPFFEWQQKNNSLVTGMIDSNEINYHLQSYFLMFRGKSIKYLKRFLTRQKLKKEKLEIIESFEIGLSQYLLKKKISLDSFFKIDDIQSDFHKNPSFLLLKKLLIDGFPLIKKKIFSGNFDVGEMENLKLNDFDFSFQTYVQCIRKVNPKFIIPTDLIE